MAIPSTPSIWSAGAHSAQALAGDGWFSFSVQAGASGVSVGMSVSDASTSPDEPTHGMRLQLGDLRIYEGAILIPGLFGYTSDDVLSIVRYGAKVLYCKGGAGERVLLPDAPFPLPGAVIYSSNTPLREGPVVLDAALLFTGDSVIDAAVHTAAPWVAASLPAPSVFASQNASARVAVVFPRMHAAAHQGIGADVSFPTMFAQASAEASAGSHLTMLPMTVESVGGVAFNGADLTMRMEVYAYEELPSNRAEITLHPLAMFASQDASAQVVAQCPPMTVFAAALGSGVLAPQIAGLLPGFVCSISSVPPEDDVFDGVVDGAVMSDAVYYHSFAVLEDVMVASGQPLMAGASPYMVEDTAAMSFSLSMAGTKDLVDVMVIDSVPLAESAYMLIQDALAMSTESVAASVSWPTISDALVIAGDAFPISLLDVSESIAASTSVLAGSTADFGDEMVAGDDLMLGSEATLEDAVTEGLVAWSEMDARSVSFALLEGHMLVSEQLLMKRPGLVAWVMNTDAGAVSWYDNWAFTSMATVGGKVFAAGPDGLHILGGGLDGVEQIDARVDYGYTEFGGYDNSGQPKPSEQKKRVPALWFGYHAAGELQATVETYGQGLGPYTYAMAPRAADQPRNSRIVPGRGLSARYWRISVANKAGCDFEVHSVAAEVATTTRRL